MLDIYPRTGFVTLSDYYPYQHHGVLEMLIGLDCPFIFTFHDYGRYIPRCFRVYVPVDYIVVLRLLSP